MNNNTQIETVVHDAVKQYENVGYNKEDDGTCALYVKGAEFGANWQKQQDEAKYKELLDSHNELLKTLENSRSFMTAHIPEKIFDMVDEAINKAKNIKL